MLAMDLQAMRKLFETGALKEAVISPAPMEKDSWVLMAIRTDGHAEQMTVARSERAKVYKSLDAVRADAARVGFREVRLQVA
jgi:hypothetical protein